MKRLCLILIVLFSAFNAYSQDKDKYDMALDQYEAICTRLLELKGMLDKGGSIQENELKDLSVQIAALRETLSEADGEMTPEQHQRFTAIKNRFLSQGEPVPELYGIVQELQIEIDRDSLHPQLHSEGSDRKKTFVMASVGVYPFDAGIMAGYGIDKWGGYVSARIRPISSHFDYTCTSDGQTAYGQIWTSGRTFSPAWRVTAGATYSLNYFWMIYAGAGYGKSRTIWEDIDGSRALVSDKTLSSLVLEAGATYSLRYLSMGLGVSSLRFKDVCPVISLGFLF